MLKNLLALLAGVLLLVLGFLFSVVVLAVIGILGLALWGYVWWKTRKLRQAVREGGVAGQVIEGEAIVVEEHDVIARNSVLPDERRPHEER